MSEKPPILLVEDDWDQATLFTQVLSLAGYAVTSAANADDALARLAASSFALLLVDWDLPGMKGDALITVARARYPQTKMILYSNHANVEDAAIACGADSWFRKTEGIVRLRELVREQLAAR